MPQTNKYVQYVKSLGFIVIFLILILGLVASIFIAVTFGNAKIDISDVYGVIFYEWFHLDGLQQYASGAIHDVVWIIRFPRVLMACTVGMGLAVCGVVMQATIKNPLADPYILGVSSGAAFGATLAVFFGVGAIFGTHAVGVMAFAGAVISSIIVLCISSRSGGSDVGRLVLGGIAVSAICSSFTSFIIFIANNRNATNEIMFWTMGSLSGAKWKTVVVVLPIMLVCTSIFWSQFKYLNVMLLGDETAITLGVDSRKLRRIYMLIASLMVGFAVYAAGVIGFVGLMIPHAIRMVFGTDHKKIIPMSALVGGIFLIWADILCRIILDHAEMPIGILISVIGAPCFIYMMFKKSYSFGGKS
ncbi:MULTISPECIES: iron ABC transporter permease [unclassified Granulicatella]|uniref:FecCD family ABC transporter permease n=1 Tax=unclassified Granulicatella TaxID=2630493 RepID=UPI0010738FF1|nr:MULTISPECIES: iron ABC transporter permease [unclassified Granulicatella]MBF0779744.1 iron ABC transporter permease [Granulicatella sp. 19428wC4_WM01]TFU96263.1 iron ABC transporter permease [Granulicatella sp. WM01]